jgi:hypothetical protein
MKLNFYSGISVLVAVLISNAQQTQSQINNSSPLASSVHSAKQNASANWQTQAMENIQQLQTAFYPMAGGTTFKVANTPTHTGFIIRNNGYAIRHVCRQPEEKSWQVDFQLLGAGREQLQWTPGHDFSVVNNQQVLRYLYPSMDVEYNNTDNGLRQNFIVKDKLPGNAPLLIHIRITSALKASLEVGNKLVFRAPGQTGSVKLTYEDLKVWDADHEPVQASMQLKGDELLIAVEDSKAAYPITVDPINKTPDWNTTVGGVVSNLLDSSQMKAALYGFAVSGLGDVNGDGFGDVAVTAPSATDVFNGNNTLATVGAVFVFYGSANGLSTTANAILQPNDAIAGALFGVSIDAGDVTGDGINDIVVGAPMDSYQVTVQELIGTSNVTVPAGKIYIFKGGTLAATNPTPYQELRLGDNFFSKGILGLMSNINVKSLFGFSVAVTEDLNGDLKKDIIVGAPAYLGTAIGSIQSGSAFVFLSNLSDNTFPTIRPLAPPTFSLLGINLPLLSGINGLLFGYSVDGTGDYNNDGKPDVVVGAPAGVNISGLTGILSGQMLGGTAYVYYGSGNNSTGVNTTIGATLQGASGNLLGNAANLFGFKVKGARSAAGARNGNILVGAPLGGLLTGTLGLTIHAGNVNLFRKKLTSPSSAVTPDQQLESPRSTSLLQALNTLDLNALFGASLDNAYDLNGDGNGDLVVGEPLSSGTNILQLQTNAVGGAAYVFYGDGTGGYTSLSPYDVSATYGSEFASVNGTALLGFSVAGAPNIRGAGTRSRIVLGAPSGALDFNGLLNLGNTLGSTLNFTNGNNGLGKAYTFDAQFSTLPVTLLELKGRAHDNVIDLNWSVEQEVNINVYELQRSSDGVNYETIMLMFPWDNNASTNQYVYTDKNPAVGINYYRLKIVDKDARSKYSYTIAARINVKNNEHILVAPNPAVGRIRIFFNDITKGSYRMELRNTVGQLQQTRTLNISQREQVEYLDRNAGMTPGIYWLSVYDSKNQNINTSRVIIQ